MRLTNQSAAALKVPEGKAYVIVFDDDLAGFGVRANAGGSRVWVVQYRNALGQTKRETLGKVGLLPAADARRAASERLARVRLGGDPSAEREAERKRAAITVGLKIESYLDAHRPRVRAKGHGESTYYMQKIWTPLHRTPVDGVTRAQVSARLNEIVKTSGPHAANRARTTLSSFYAWLIAEGVAESNPVVGTRKPHREESRQRVLKPEEIKAILGALPVGDFGRIVRLLLLTAQRRDEVADMPWAELDLATGLWSLPRERTKNGLSHDVPLSRPALAILAGAPRIEGRGLVFGSGAGGFQGFTRAKAALDRASGVKDWRLHDLRRTAATGMGDLGVLPHVVEAVLNHISGTKAGVAGVYNYALYNPEKRAALDLWARHLAGLDPGIELAAANAEAPLAQL
ncbi:tyrosine-type recombinase/integrase [Methylobacterium goesingense]|uniref:Integrase n=1 Tax=Methylobacterium goesingense TaxID=243690 RepID=A0ABV2L3H2_9HYPH|nr:site-specific integrase [Methylobacterium goesingense]GJD73128.1 Prophage integrase IntA [Methylobacterium goesingense]